MKIIKRALTILAAKELADKLARETGKIHSVRSHKTTTPATFYVVEGMVGDTACKYTARPATLKIHDTSFGSITKKIKREEENEQG